MKNILVFKIILNIALIGVGLFIIFILGNAIYELEIKDPRPQNVTSVKSNGGGIPVIDLTQESDSKIQTKSVDVRVYGFTCNKEGVLWERRREAIDVTEAVRINGDLVHCSPSKNDIGIEDGSYIINNEGSYSVNGINYPRQDIHLKWDAREQK